MAKTVRIRMLRQVLGERRDPETGELEVLTPGSVVDVSEQIGAEFVSARSAEFVEDKTKLSTAEMVHAPAAPVAADPSVNLADIIAQGVAAGVAQALAAQKK